MDRSRKHHYLVGDSLLIYAPESQTALATDKLKTLTSPRSTRREKPSNFFVSFVIDFLSTYTAE